MPTNKPPRLASLTMTRYTKKKDEKSLIALWHKKGSETVGDQKEKNVIQLKKVAKLL